MLTERENCLRFMRREKVEWIPILEDCIDFVIPEAILERPKVGDSLDWFGCAWSYNADIMGFTPDTSVPVVVPDITQWRDYVTFPDLDAIDFEASAAKDLANYDREGGVLTIFWESGPFERSHHLLGFEEALVALYEEPESYAELLEALTDFRIEAMRRCFEAYKPDYVLTHDDLGHNLAPFMSLDMYRELIKPCHYRLLHAIHEMGVGTIHHSCGCMEQFVGDLIECGADVIHPFQGGAVNPHQKEIVEQYGDQVLFINALAPIINMPNANEEELRAEVRRVIDTFGPKQSIMLNLSSMDSQATTDILFDEGRRYSKKFMER